MNNGLEKLPETAGKDADSINEETGRRNLPELQGQLAPEQKA